MVPRIREHYIESLFILAMAVMFAAGVVTAREWPAKSALFPTLIGVSGCIIAVILSLWTGIKGGEAKAPEGPGGAADLYLDVNLRSGEALKRTFIICAWLAGIFAGTWLLGQLIALPLFVFLYLKVGSNEGWFLSLFLTACAIAFLYGVFDQVIHASWYEGELFRFLGIELF
jgi:hypothetical protein